MELVSLTKLSDAEVAQLSLLWNALYKLQKEQGMLVELPTDAFEHWWKSLEPTLGRFSWLFVARNDSQLAGFIAARMRTLPGHFGGTSVGLISDVYMDPQFRGQGAGRSLMKFAMENLHSSGLSRLELQVIEGNPQAKDLYASLGWEAELTQMVHLNEKRAGSLAASGPKSQKP